MDQRFVKLNVGFCHPCPVVSSGGFAHRFHNRLQDGNRLRRIASHDPPQSKNLQGAADRQQHFLDLDLGRRRHPRLPVWRAHDQTFLFQLTQRFPDRGPADAKLFRNVRLEQTLARFEFPGNDGVSEHICSLFPRRLWPSCGKAYSQTAPTPSAGARSDQ